MSAVTHPAIIHPSAVVSPKARIGFGCFIGPYSIIGDDVELEDGVRLESHCVVDGRTLIGAETHVFPFVSIGLASQDLKYQGEPSETKIGKRNNIREFVTIHRGTAGGGMLTKTGDDCLIMAQAHIAHDCLVGDGVIMANAATLAGCLAQAPGLPVAFEACLLIFEYSNIRKRAMNATLDQRHCQTRQHA
jgi:UDP-N-acetylglucosamine acyltransferase